MYEIYVSPASELYHHGIKGQKWGVRRFQNPDGSLTDAGRLRYGKGHKTDRRLMTYESAKSRKYAKKYGEDSDTYKKSSDLDQKMASIYEKDIGPGGLGKRVAKLVLLGGTGEKTYNMSRATGRGRLESFIRAKLDINPSLLVRAGVGGLTETALNTVAGTISAIGSLGVSKLAGASLSQLTEAAQKGAGTALATVGGLNKFAGGVAGLSTDVGIASRGTEMSAQQAWLRNNYIKKGSVQDQQNRDWKGERYSSSDDDEKKRSKSK